MAEEKTSIVGLSEILGATKAPEKKFPCVTVIAGRAAGRLFRLDEASMIVGRGTDVQIRVDDEGISRRHIELVVNHTGQVMVRDLGSLNGTFVNGEKKAEHYLSDGDRISLGSTTILKFSFTDNDEELYQRNLYESATRDALTGAFNKKFFIERLQSEFAYAQRHNSPLCLCLLDIDFFKKVNDTHGHPGGDAVLKMFAQATAKMIRAEDVFCRYGGEEFALILRATAMDVARGLAERIRQKVETEVCHFDGADIRITCSLGVAQYTAGMQTPEDLITLTDDRLYTAKQSGRNRVISA